MTTNNDTKSLKQSDDLTPVMQFPMMFPIKVMGLNTPDFPATICQLATNHFSDFDAKTMTINLSRTKKYKALSIVVNAQSKEQLDDFYRALTSHPMVKVAL